MIGYHSGEAVAQESLGRSPSPHCSQILIPNQRLKRWTFKKFF